MSRNIELPYSTEDKYIHKKHERVYLTTRQSNYANMSEKQHKHLLSAISEYLPRAGQVCKADAEDVDTIIDTLHATFKVEAAEPGILPPGKSLLDVFQKGLEAFGVSKVANPWAETKPVDTVESSPVFQKFLASVQKKGYFKDCEEGSEEYESRYLKVLNKFKKRLESQKEDDSKKVDDTDRRPQ